RQALINLVDNAIKYAPASGDIRIRLSGSSSSAFLDVSDTGPGVSTDRPTRIFDRFYRDRQPLTESVRGTGLGLAIAKWAVEVNGGKLTLEQPDGLGSTFRMTLPSAASGRPRRSAIA